MEGDAHLDHEGAGGPVHTHAHGQEDAKKGLKRALLVSFIIYLVIAILMYPAIVAHMNTVTNGTGGDVYQNMWFLWWTKYALSHGASLYTTSLAFWPVGGNLIFSVFSPISGVLTIPFQAVGLPFALNALFLLGFALSGITCFLLAEYITKNRYAAFLAGLFFAFSSFHIAQAPGHVGLINIEWVPLFIYFFIRAIKEHGRRWYYNSIGLGASFVLIAFMGDFEQAIMVLIAAVIIMVLYLLKRDGRKLILSKGFLLSIVLGVVVALIVGSWGFIPLVRSIANGGLSTANSLSDLAHNAYWSDNLLSFFLPSYYNGLLHGIAAGYASSIYTSDITEGVSYIGYVVLALALYGIYRNRKSLASSVPWIVLAIVFGWLALGPYLAVGGAYTSLPEPYIIYHYIPILNVIREPGRLDLMVSLALAVLAALGAEKVFGALRSGKGLLNRKVVLVAIIALLFLIESNGLSLNSAQLANMATTVQPSKLYQELGGLNANFSVLELPTLPILNSTHAQLYEGMELYQTALTRKPVIGGYLGRETLQQTLSVYNIPLAVQVQNLEAYGSFNYSSPVHQNYTAQTIFMLYNYLTGYVVVDKAAFSNSTLVPLENYLGYTFGPYVYNDNTTIAFQTYNAMNDSVFKSFVAFPLLTQWEPAQIPYNGSSLNVWIPVQDGEVTLAVPYRNLPANSIPTSGVTRVNTTIGFDAVAINTRSGPLAIDAAIGNSTPVVLARINVSDIPESYQIKASLPAGPDADPVQVYFLESSGTSGAYVGLYNITFT